MARTLSPVFDRAASRHRRRLDGGSVGIGGLAGPVVLLVTVFGVVRPSFAAPCGAAEIAAVRAPATAAQRSVTLACDLRLAPEDTVTRQIVFAGAAASGVTLDCGGAHVDGGPGSINHGRDMIVVRSRGATPAEMAADRPSSIVVRNCRIDGSIRVVGLGPNGEAPGVRASSLALGHTARAQAAAPTGLTFSGLTLTAAGRTPFYLAPGVTRVTLETSFVGGRSDGPAIYLDAESAGNRILGNRIAVATSRREQLAIDGSADNEVRGNRFGALGNGGIDLYRNCGEGGTVRHQTPHGNTIADNEFDDTAPATAPVVRLGSRNGWRWYCFQDRGHPFGSSLDDGDHADENRVIDNRFVRRDPARAIADDGRDNLVAGNREIAAPTP